MSPKTVTLAHLARDFEAFNAYDAYVSLPVFGRCKLTAIYGLDGTADVSPKIKVQLKPVDGEPAISVEVDSMALFEIE